MENEKRFTFEFTEEEREAFAVVRKVLQKIYVQLAKEKVDTVVSTGTGECFSTKELNRTRGIVHGFVDNEGIEWIEME